MMLQTRPVAIAAGIAAGLAVVAIAWQLARSPGSGSGKGTALPVATSASGVVTGVVTGAAPSAPSAATGSVSSAASAPAPSNTNTVAKHPIAPPRAGKPAILPNEVDATVDKVLGGHKKLTRHLWMEPLARRFVASVDGLGKQPAPTTLWLVKPAPGTLALTKDAKQPEQATLNLVANSARYTGFINWAMSLDNRRLLDLYARLYPLLQQSYVESGHPGGHFNDRLIEVIDQMLATPTPKGPLHLRQIAETRPPSALSTTPRKPRYEFADPELEALTTGQKLLLRIGPGHAAKVKQKLKALRVGLLKLGA